MPESDRAQIEHNQSYEAAGKSLVQTKGSLLTQNTPVRVTQCTLTTAIAAAANTQFRGHKL